MRTTGGLKENDEDLCNIRALLSPTSTRQMIYFTYILAKKRSREMDSDSIRVTRVTAADLDLSPCHLSGLLFVSMWAIRWVGVWEGRTTQTTQWLETPAQLRGNLRHCFLITSLSVCYQEQEIQTKQHSQSKLSIGLPHSRSKTRAYPPSASSSFE